MTKLFQYSATLIDRPSSPNGRFCRLSFAAWSLLNGIICSASILLVLLIFGQFHDTNFASFFNFLSYISIFIIQIYFVYFSFIFTIRRLHDRNQSGWYSLFLLIPLFNFTLFIYLLFSKGDEGMNKYGFTRNIFGWEKLLGQANMLISPLVIVVILFYMLMHPTPEQGFKRLIFPSLYMHSAEHKKSSNQ